MSNIKKKKLPPKVENMSKDELLVFLKKKKECENVAQNIVMQLLENGITEEQLIKCLPRINQCHYEDITEERAIIKHCGYPICVKPLPDKLPTQQYKISCKTNRVFDITLRKNYCSNGCYKASMFLKDQLLTSPLWCRELEEIPKFTLIPLDTVGVLGEEIDLSLVKKVDVETTKDNNFQSFLDFAEASLTEVSKNEISKDVKLDTVQVISNNTNESKQEDVIQAGSELEKKQEQKCNENQLDCSNTDKTVSPNQEKDTAISESADAKKTSLKKPKSSKIVGEVIERRSENKIDPIISEGMKLLNLNETAEKNKKNKEKKLTKDTKNMQPIAVAVMHIEKCLGEWFTLETMLFLFGKERVKEIVTDKGECIKEYLNNMASGLFYKSTSYDQYQQLCRKLNLLELEDRRYDNNFTSAKQLKPLPHYSMLQEESKKLDIKVKAFLKGEMEIPDKVDMSDAEKTPEEQGESLPNLPLVDKTAQNALRRKIVLNGFNKVLPDLLQSLDIANREMNSDLRLLVATFDLQAHNIVFKPQQWNMIAIIVIKLLSIKDVRLQKALAADKANRHMQLLLMSYEQDGGYLDRVASWLTDVDRLLDKNNTQLTPGVKS